MKVIPLFKESTPRKSTPNLKAIFHSVTKKRQMRNYKMQSFILPRGKRMGQSEFVKISEHLQEICNEDGIHPLEDGDWEIQQMIFKGVSDGYEAWDILFVQKLTSLFSNDSDDKLTAISHVLGGD